MKKVNTEIEAFNFCKENCCKIEFKRKSNNIPAHVIVSSGIRATTIGENLVEAVNRIVDMYNTPPIYHEKLPWWEEQKNFYKV